MLFIPLIVLAGCSLTDADSKDFPAPTSSPAASSSGTPATGMVWTTGLNQDRQLGWTTEESSPAFGLVDLTEQGKIVAIGGGGRHSLAVTTEGSVLSWGSNDAGQLGRGSPGTAKGPGEVIAADGASGLLTGVTAVAADSDFSMALRADGTVVTWGRGDAGQRGIGRTGAPDHPTVVQAPEGDGPLRGVKQISADGRTELALLNDGRVVAWGANDFGQLGDGTQVDRSRPVYVVAESGVEQLSDVLQISVGGQHAVALLADGGVLTWGHNDMGQLGDGTRTDRLLPTPVVDLSGQGTLTDVVQISAAEKHMIAVRGDGTAVAWGNNSAGQLGDRTVDLRPYPVSVVGSGGGPELREVKAVAAGEAYGAAILKDGTLRTWGANGKGQLGSGDRVHRDEPGPVAVEGGGRLKQTLAVAAGERHLLVLTASRGILRRN